MMFCWTSFWFLIIIMLSDINFWIRPLEMVGCFFHWLVYVFLFSSGNTIQFSGIQIVGTIDV